LLISSTQGLIRFIGDSSSFFFFEKSLEADYFD